MKKKSIELSVPDLQVKRKGTSILHKVKDSEIDYSDIPALNNEDLEKFKHVDLPLVGESTRQDIFLRVESNALSKLKKVTKHEC